MQAGCRARLPGAPCLAAAVFCSQTGAVIKCTEGVFVRGGVGQFITAI